MTPIFRQSHHLFKCSVLFAVLTLLGAAHRLHAEEIKVEAKLVWGTNQDKSKKPAHKPVDAKTAKKLQKIFKWKNYFLEKRVVATVPNRSTQKLVMSKSCTVRIKELPGAPVEVELIGEGKSVNKTTKPFHRNEWIIIGGDDKDECAWFVILKRL